MQAEEEEWKGLWEKRKQELFEKATRNLALENVAVPAVVAAPVARLTFTKSGVACLKLPYRNRISFKKATFK